MCTHCPCPAGFPFLILISFLAEGSAILCWAVSMGAAVDSWMVGAGAEQKEKGKKQPIRKRTPEAKGSCFRKNSLPPVVCHELWFTVS